MFFFDPFQAQMQQMSKMMKNIGQLSTKMNVIARALNIDHDPAFMEKHEDVADDNKRISDNRVTPKLPPLTIESQRLAHKVESD